MLMLHCLQLIKNEHCLQCILLCHTLLQWCAQLASSEPVRTSVRPALWGHSRMKQDRQVVMNVQTATTPLAVNPEVQMTAEVSVFVQFFCWEFSLCITVEVS